MPELDRTTVLAVEERREKGGKHPALQRLALEFLLDAIKGLRQRFERIGFGVSVSNSLSGRDWELDQVPAVGDPTHIVQLCTGDRASAGEG